MKKSFILFGLSMTVLAMFTGCSQQVKLQTGMENSSTIKSCSYDMTVSADATGLKSNSSDTGIAAGLDAGVSSMLSAGKVSLNFNGKMLKTDDRSKLSSNVKVSSGGVSFETPIYIDSSNTKLDFDLFVGVPAIFKDVLGAELANISNLHLASKDLESYVKSNSSADENKKFQDSMTKLFDNKGNKNTQVSKDMLLSFNTYLTKNKAKVQTFAKLGDASASKNGIYTIKLSKEDLKAIVSDYFSNETYFTNFKDAAKETEGLYSVGASDTVKPVKVDDAKTIISDYNKALDANKTVDIVATITIAEKLITKTNIKFAVVNTDGNVTFEIDSKLSDINNVTSIVAPDKNSDKTLNIMKLIDPSTK
ncbi:hypothetical protein G9F72_012045 [Clostridium estertheticum]|uniref:hypothetical protein n=1 Tax=Clostridium estertheticum TaxID=238834 RepID=UPI0013E8FE2B|nr:hypothetical protein [Clostridium estertheticum]MBZ9687055.1 hypothetical protein [Clostridium estertheticum]